VTGVHVPDDDRFRRAIAAIDQANGDDPNRITVGGVERPKEQAHAEAMTAWVLRLDPAATEEQRIAARAHHLRRWSIPRGTFPEGRAGYLKWRTTLRKQHAEEVGGIMRSVGYDDASVERVQQIINKVKLSSDPVVQVHEDALCLVFIETQLAQVADQLGDDKSVDVIAKTAKKMSQRAIELVADLPLGDHERALIARALAEP
jgi:hypothetical protein